VADRASALLARATSHGTALLRSHVDIDPDIGLANLEGVLEACARHADAIDVQLVAFPQSGILASPGTEQLLADAVRLGAGFVGGLDPAGFDGDAVRHLDIVFGLAERTGAGVDIHLHDGGGLGVHELELIAERTAALGMAGRVAVSHAYCLGEVDDPVLGATADRLAAAGVAIFTSAPGAAPMPPVKRLISAGVQVFAGSDNIRDLWAPYGTGDPLEVAMMVGYRSDFRTDEDLALALSMVTDRAAAALGVSPWGIADGAPAHLVALPVRTVGEAVVERPPRSAVIRHGVVIREGGR
jgi:cytosine deaminase